MTQPSQQDAHDRVAESLDVSRREFMLAGVAALAPASTSAASAQSLQERYEFYGIAVLQGPRDARPSANSGFLNNRIAYAYRYIDEVTKASWYIDDTMTDWHPEPVGVPDVTTPEDHAVSIVSRNSGLYVRRYQ